MKAKCIVNMDLLTGPEFGVVYDVLSIERGYYRIVDRSDEDYLYPANCFEVVDSLPEAPIITTFPRTTEDKVLVEKYIKRMKRKRKLYYMAHKRLRK